MRPNLPRVFQVIESAIVRGNGETGNPWREVIQYHTLDGLFLAERDNYVEQRASSPPTEPTEK